MVKKIIKKGGGGKLNRTETVTLRLDPRLRYLTELAARTQRRTTSGFIEWAIERSLREIILEQANEEHFSGEVTLADQSFALWDVDEPDRFVLLAFNYPHLLNYEEQILWKIIQENGYFWKSKKSPKSGDEWTWKVRLESLIPGRLREFWEVLKSVADGSEDKEVLPEKFANSPDFTGRPDFSDAFKDI